MGRCSDARERLLTSAGRLVRERGYTAVSVQDICEDAGLKKGSFYHFFPSKRDLVLATLESNAAQYEGLIEQNLSTDLKVKDQVGNIFKAVRDALTVQAGGCRGCPVGMLAMEMADRDEAIAAKVREVFELLRAGFERILRRGVERSELHLDDPRQIAETLVVYLQGAILWAKTAGDPSVMNRLQIGAEALIDGAKKSAT